MRWRNMRLARIIRNRKVYLPTLTLAAIAVLGTPVLATGTASAATTARTVSAPVGHGVCVQHGKPNSVLGNWMLYDWNNTPCPAGTYGPVALNGFPEPAAPTAKDFSSALSVPTGGSFVTNSTDVGTVDLKAGSYLVSVNAKATPSGSSTAVFPGFYVYNQARNSNFTGDLFNVGSGALAQGSTSLDSYYSGSSVITLASATTLHLYAFGYSPDKSGQSYTLDDLTVTAVPVP
jgi:hypothetical protein